VQFQNNSIDEEVSIYVINTLGQRVFSTSKKISSLDRKIEIDLKDAIREVYLIEIKTKNNFIVKKIMISD